MTAADMRRPLSEICERWRATQEHGASFGALQKAVTQNPQASPCVVGCRSLCWKTFLLFRDASSGQDWIQTLRQARASYGERRDALLRYIKHPEELASTSSDPLADDPDSPWTSLRLDEAIRTEIEQDVRRLPDEPFYHTDRIQTLILDVLFVWCKLHPRAGGYRQGMHELLAPIVLVLEQDSVVRTEAAGAWLGTTGLDDGEGGAMMVEMLDADFVEHDAYAIFEPLMRAAGEFYRVEDDAADGEGSGVVVQGTSGGRGGFIVEKSHSIHEHRLRSVDPELADHFKAIEILPQIFLIRWIRLLFGREFPLDQLLVLWDVIFAVDPSLDIVDLVCVAMMLRIRWELMEADYAAALQLLLRYRVPEAPHHPCTFVEDALYLQSHLTLSGGSALMLKYSGRMPAVAAPASPPSTSPAMSRAGTPSFPSISFRPRSAASRAQHRSSPLPSPARYILQQGGVEALFQGAARNVLERGERLGINQAVRDAMGEIRRNVQTLQERRSELSSSSAGGGSGLGGAAAAATGRTLGMMERRNRVLARMLDESIAALGGLATTITTTGLEDGKTTPADTIGAVVSQLRSLKDCLEDSALDIPKTSQAKRGVVAADVVMHDSGEAASTMVQPDAQAAASSLSALIALAGEEQQRTTGRDASVAVQDLPPAALLDAMDISADVMVDQAPSQPSSINAIIATNSPSFSPATQTPIAPSQPITQLAEIRPSLSPPTPASPPSSHPTHPPLPTASSSSPPTLSRPEPPVPTRSSIAQSSFAWMLEPDETPASAPPPNAFPAVRRSHASAGPPGGTGHRNKRSSFGRNSAAASSMATRRERNAFLFGEVTTVGNVGMDGALLVRSEEIFGLQPLGAKSRSEGHVGNQDMPL